MFRQLVCRVVSCWGRVHAPANRAPATSGLFCRLRKHKRMIGVFLTRDFPAAYLANAKNYAKNHPEVQFQSENQSQNLRNRPEVDRRQQLRPGYTAREWTACRSRGCGLDRSRSRGRSRKTSQKFRRNALGRERKESARANVLRRSAHPALTKARCA